MPIKVLYRWVSYQETVSHTTETGEVVQSVETKEKLEKDVEYVPENIESTAPTGVVAEESVPTTTALEEAERAALEAWWSYVPDQLATFVPTASGPQALQTAWEDRLEEALGAGDPASLRRYLALHGRGLETAAHLLSGELPPGLISAELAHLRRHDPEAVSTYLDQATYAFASAFSQGAETRLLVLEKGALIGGPIGGDPMSSEVAGPSQLAVAVEHDGVGRIFALQPEAVPNLEAVEYALSLPPEEQAAFFLEGEGRGWFIEVETYEATGPDALFGTEAGRRTVVAADPYPYVSDDDPDNTYVGAIVNVAGIEDANKLARFEGEHLETLALPVFASFASLEPPVFDRDRLPEQVAAAMNLPPGMLEPTEPAVQAILNVVDGVPDEDVSFSVVPIVFHSEETGMVQLPLFAIEVDGQQVIVEPSGRTYSGGFEDWRRNNELPAGEVLFPGREGDPSSFGALSVGPDGQPEFVREGTQTWGEYLWQGAETAALIGGTVLATGAILGLGGAPLFIGGAVVSAFEAVDAGLDIYDRYTHGQTPDANDWLQLAGGVAGTLGGFGALGRGLDTASDFVPGPLRIPSQSALYLERAIEIYDHTRTATVLADPDVSFEDKLRVASGTILRYHAFRSIYGSYGPDYDSAIIGQIRKRLQGVKAPSKRGNAPIGEDGHPVELHHVEQTADGQIDEMTRTDHRLGDNYALNHSNTGEFESEIDRKQFGKDRRKYWKNEWDSGRFKDLED